MTIVILDRDGVINHDSKDYIRSPEEWRPIEGSLEAIAHLCHFGHVVYVATNQSGIARGYYSERTLESIHRKMCDLIEGQGGRLAGIFYCPHHPDDNCDCRKPKTGLLQQITSRTGADLAGCPFVGDSQRDLDAARAFGCRPVLVLTGNGEETARASTTPVDTYPDLRAFATAMTMDAGPEHR